MVIKKIKINNFRCFKQKNIEFSSKNNIILGSNAIGKTSVLEAITCLSILKSFRTNDQMEMICENNDYFFVEGELLSGNNQAVVSVYFDKTLKRVKVNNYVYKKLSDYVGFFNVVTFSALDFLILKGASSERRRMLDLIFCQISKDYLIMSNYYKKLLKDRNALLKAFILENRDKALTLIEAVTEQMITCGNKIIEFRRTYCQKISEFSKKIHYEISSGFENFELKYTSSSEKLTAEIFRKTFEEDVRRGYTTIGPHRDDYIFIINNKNISVYGSQGQQRNAMLSVKLAMADLLFEIKKEAPTLLLDDVFSELDEQRQNALIDSLNPEYQTIITTASISDLKENIINNSLIINLERESD